MNPNAKQAVILAQPESPLLSLRLSVLLGPAPHPPNFDRVARAYRWLEYASLGKLLEQTREHFIPQLRTASQALILGDGDGRFTSKLLAANPAVQIEAIDLSAAMRAQLRRRTATQAHRVQTHQGDARTHIPQATPDLITTHFLLDCLSQPEVQSLVDRLAPTLPAGTLWVVSEFRIPQGLARLPAWLYVRTLYLAFRLLTGLRVRRLPDHATPLQRAGFVLIAERLRLFGMLTAQLWRRENNP